MKSIDIREKTSQDTDWAKTLMLESWGSEVMVLQGRLYHPAELPGYIAEIDQERVGLITYLLEQRSCEIITLNSLQPGLGIGTHLLDAVKRSAKQNGCTEMKLFTTNDNTDALRFYQKYGFHLDMLLKDGIAPDRALKPEIPMKAENGIPIRDYLLLKIGLES